MAGKGKPGPDSAEEAAARKAAIWKARVDAVPVAEIAKEHAISVPRVYQILKEHAAEITQQAADELRKVEMDKLDILERTARGIIARYESHDDPTVLGAIDRVLKVGQRRAALGGLDAPVKSEVTSYAYTVNGVDPEALK
jgi:hypothetical protein